MPLTITYVGPGVRVDPSKITEGMEAPDTGSWGGPPFREGDETPGHSASQLFLEATQSGALIAPDGIELECYGDDNDEGGGVILVAYPAGEPRRGVTAGWRDVNNFSAEGDEDSADPAIIARCLRFFAAELNVALGVPPCECDTGRYPGMLVGIFADGMDPPPGWTWVEKCDMCERFDSDEAAAIELVRQGVAPEYGYFHRETLENRTAAGTAAEGDLGGCSVAIHAVVEDRTET